MTRFGDAAGHAPDEGVDEFDSVCLGGNDPKDVCYFGGKIGVENGGLGVSGEVGEGEAEYRFLY